MPTYYLDASAVVKRYVSEMGSAWVQALCSNEENTKQLPPLTFVAADDDLLKAAEAEGLPTENPNLHS